MSVRRLADENLQPADFKFNRAMTAEAKKWVAKYPKGREQSAVIPLLMLAQEQEGWVTRAAIEHIAEKLDMPKIRVMEVATFYTQFMLQPVGKKAHVQVCGTTPCMLRGAEDLKKVCQSKINHDPFALNADGTLSWEEVECQGACVNAPMVMIGKDTYEDLTPERLEEIIEAFEAGKGDTITPGPQIDRHFSAPVGGRTTLLDDAPKKQTSRGKKDADANEPQEMTEAARPETEAPEGDPTIRDPDKATGPGRRKAAKADVDAKVEDAGPTLKVAGSAKSVEPKKKKADRKAEGGNPTMRVASTASGFSGAKAEPVEQPAKKSAKKATATKPKSSKKKAPAEQPEPVTYDKDKPNPTMKLASTSSSVKPKAAAKKAEENRPRAVEKPAKPDNLRMISGVGPKIEGILHDLGIWKFEQIAAWTKAERDWVDDHLKFKGRIEREDWVRQAKALAKGGRDEYVRVFGKEPT